VVGAAVVVAAGNFHTQDMLYKHTWQDLEEAGHNRMDHILGDNHSSRCSIGSALAEAGTKNQQRASDYLSNKAPS
jgi:hypothetical protein